MPEEVFGAPVRRIHTTYGPRPNKRSAFLGYIRNRLKAHGYILLAVAIFAPLIYLLPVHIAQRDSSARFAARDPFSARYEKSGDPFDSPRQHPLTKATYVFNLGAAWSFRPLSSPPAREVQRQALAARERESSEAVSFVIHEGGVTVKALSSQRDVGAALRDAGVRLGPADRVWPSAQSPLTSGMHVYIERANRVSLKADGDVRVVYTYETSVEGVVRVAGLQLAPEDEVDPPLTATVKDGSRVVVTRVKNDLTTTEEVIPAGTVEVYDNTLPQGQKRVRQGTNGVLHKEFKVTYRDGQEVARELVREWVDPEPKPQTVIYGTWTPPLPAMAASVPTADDGSPLECVRTLRVWATWYNETDGGKSPNNPYYGVTTSGLRLQKGIVAVDPRVIPLGTRMYVPGYGMAIAADTGGGIKGNMIDLAYPEGSVVDWRTGWVDVCILD